MFPKFNTTFKSEKSKLGDSCGCHLLLAMIRTVCPHGPPLELVKCKPEMYPKLPATVSPSFTSPSFTAVSPSCSVPKLQCPQVAVSPSCKLQLPLGAVFCGTGSVEDTTAGLQLHVLRIFAVMGTHRRYVRRYGDTRPMYQTIWIRSYNA